MGKAFVAKLAKEGARDPEALAAWIGRKKHGKAFGKLAAKGRKDSSKNAGEGASAATPARPKQEKRRAFPKQAAAKVAAKAEPRDKDRGFDPADLKRPFGQRRFAVSDQELNALRAEVGYDQKMIDRQEARGATREAARTRQEMEARMAQIADAEYARETVAGDRAYGQSAQAPRAAANEAVRKARQTGDPQDWEAAAQAAEAFSRQAGKSEYGSFDAGWFADEAKRARVGAENARQQRKNEAARKAERTLPPPKPGETPVAHATFLDSEAGIQSFGDGELGRKVISRNGTAMPDTGAEGHESALKNVSPAFRKKVAEARASGRPWLHHISLDSGGAEIHKLQVVGADGKPVTTQFLERNTKAWKAKEQQRWASS